MLSLFELVVFGGLGYGALVYLVVCHTKERDIGYMGVVFLLFGFIGASTISYGAHNVMVADQYVITTMNLTSNTNVTSTVIPAIQLSINQYDAWVFTHIAIAMVFIVNILYEVIMMIGRAWKSR